MTVHSYRTDVSWSGSTGAGYRVYSRTHTGAATETGEPLTLSADPAFRGDPAHPSPEGLLVLSASSCQLLAFLAVAARAGVDVLDYRDTADATMDDAVAPVSIGVIHLRPVITVRAGTDHARVTELVHQGHEECYIANSLRTQVLVTPEIVDG